MEIFETVGGMVDSAKEKVKAIPGKVTKEVKDFFGLTEAKDGSPVAITTPAPGLINKRYNAMMSGQKFGQQPAGVPTSYEWPEGLTNPDSNQSGPMMVITAFKYKRNKSNNPARIETAAGLLSTDPTKYDIPFVIHLPLPGNLRTAIQNNFESYENIFNAVGALGTDTISNLGTDAANLINELKGINASDAGAGMFTPAAAAAPAAINALMNGAGWRGAAAAGAKGALKQASIESGLSLNPLTESTYISPAVATHSFDYTLIPKNHDETRSILKMIRALRIYSTGESLSATTPLILKYPVMFNISFIMPDGQYILGPSTIPDCFLESIEVVYNPTGPSSRLTPYNTPTSYRLSMTFKNAKAMMARDIDILDPISFLTEYGGTTPEEAQTVGGFYTKIL